MTKNKTAICTPTKTREEFESILRELDGVGVKWSNGKKPSDMGWKKEKRYLTYRSDEIRWGCLSVGEQLPRADFIAAIKRDFARDMGKEASDIIDNWPGWKKEYARIPAISKIETTGECEHEMEDCFSGMLCSKCGHSKLKEQPKMNYKKMTKAELIRELKERDDKLFCVEYDYKELASDFREVEEQRDTARATADKYEKQCASIEKANAEQAETIKEMDRSHMSDSASLQMVDDAKVVSDRKRAEAEKENTRIKRLAAQILCADVLEAPK